MVVEIGRILATRCYFEIYTQACQILYGWFAETKPLIRDPPANPEGTVVLFLLLVPRRSWARLFFRLHEVSQHIDRQREYDGGILLRRYRVQCLRLEKREVWDTRGSARAMQKSRITSSMRRYSVIHCSINPQFTTLDMVYPSPTNK